MSHLKNLLCKADRAEGFSPEEVSAFFRGAQTGDWQSLFEIAASLTRRQFDRRIHFYVPIYFSSSCVNDCVYCGYRRSNTGLRRARLSAEELTEEAACLWGEGFRNLMLVAGEHSILAGEERVCALISELIRVSLDFCLNVEVGPLSGEGYRQLRNFGVSRVTLYQETYNREIYASLHAGPKKDFDGRYFAMARAMEAGIRKVGLGFLLGISDYQHDLAELVRHAWFLKKEYGFFPVTMSFPRLKHASGMDAKHYGFSAVADAEFEKVIALARAALPSVGIPLTTREPAAYRDRLLRLGIGITHLSAGTRTSPGGYQVHACLNEEGQFSTSDGRTLKEMTETVRQAGYEAVFRFEDENILNAPVLKTDSPESLKNGK